MLRWRAKLPFTGKWFSGGNYKYEESYEWLHRSANNGFVFVVGKRKIISGVIFDAESESEIRISLSRQDFEIFEVMCSKNGVFRYFWGYVQGARNFFGFFLKCHHLALLFPFKMSYWTVTSDFFHKDTTISSFDIYLNNLMSIHIDSLVYWQNKRPPRA